MPPVFSLKKSAFTDREAQEPPGTLSFYQ